MDVPENEVVEVDLTAALGGDPPLADLDTFVPSPWDPPFSPDLPKPLLRALPGGQTVREKALRNRPKPPRRPVPRAAWQL